MKEKFFNQTGEAAFRIWMFSLAVEYLKKHPGNAEKVANLSEKVKTFASGNWVKFNATAEEKDNLQQILADLANL